MKKYLLYLFIAVSIQYSAVAQTFDPVWAGRFQTVFDSTFNTSNFRGAAAGVYVPGQGMWTSTNGFSSLGVPITIDMRFGVGSVSKTFIAVNLLKLQELGLVSLDDHLYQWIPSYPNIDSNITVRQLLSHQSGIADLFRDNLPLYNDSIWADTSRIWTPQEILATIAPQKFDPGHGYYYSNTNYILAGLVIEAVTGNPWVQSLHNLILDPINMDSTFVGALETPNGLVAHEWAYNNTTEIINSPMPSLYSMMAAPGGIFSNVSELLQWYTALFSGNIISNNSLQELIKMEPTTFYGLGLYTAPLNQLTYYHNGGMFGYESTLVYDAKTKSTMCVLINGGTSGMTDIFYPLFDVLTEEKTKQPNDAGISVIVNPRTNKCIAPITPTVTLNNYGSDPLATVTINYQIDGGTLNTYNWSGTLTTGTTTTIGLPQITPSNGSHIFTCYTSNPNGSSEGYYYNDTAKVEFIMNLNPPLTAPLFEGFEGAVYPPARWLENTNSSLEWGKTSLAFCSGNYSLVRNNYGDQVYPGAFYDIDMPFINISAISGPALFFKHAYAVNPGKSDFLRVQISSDCGATWQSLFYKGGSALSTAPNTTEPFYPANANQWKSDTISLASFSGDIIIRFKCINDNGNNLYIDDVSIDQLTGIYAIADQNTSIHVYPNPATNNLTVENIAANSEIFITDITGKVIYKSQNVQSEKIEVNTTDLADGIYFVNINSNYMDSNIKFIKINQFK